LTKKAKTFAEVGEWTAQGIVSLFFSFWVDLAGFNNNIVLQKQQAALKEGSHACEGRGLVSAHLLGATGLCKVRSEREMCSGIKKKLHTWYFHFFKFF
jgi:hypothetical protein